MEFKNWQTGLYSFSHKRKLYSCKELKKYFYIDGSEVVYCTKDFGNCKRGNYYLVTEWGGDNIFCVQDWDSWIMGKQCPAGVELWVGKEYMIDDPIKRAKAIEFAKDGKTWRDIECNAETSKTT